MDTTRENAESLVDRLRRQATAIHIAAPQPCAGDVSDGLLQAAALILALVEERDKWKEAVIDGCIVRHIYTAEHDTNPRKALNDCACWDQAVALDPAVSQDAVTLRDTHLNRAEKAEADLARVTQERDALKAENAKLRAALAVVHFKQEPMQ